MENIFFPISGTPEKMEKKIEWDKKGFGISGKFLKTEKWKIFFFHFLKSGKNGKKFNGTK